MLRVLIFHPALAPYRIDLFNALAQQCELRVIFLNKNLLNQKFDQNKLTKMLQVDYRYLTSGINVGSRTIRVGIGKEINHFSPDVVITHEYTPTTLSVLWQKLVLRKKVKQVIWSADNPMMMHNENPIRGKLRDFSLQHIDGLILYTNDIKKYYVNQFHFTQSIAVVPNIPNSVTFRQKLTASGESTRQIVNKYHLEGKRVVLYVGRLTQAKRLDRLLKAFSKIISYVPNSILVFVGNGDQRKTLNNLSKKLQIQKQILFTGRLEGDKLAAWYRLGSVFVLPSENEPFGAVINEALLAGMPAICSNTVGAKILIQDNINGNVIDASNNQLFEQSLLTWLTRSPEITRQQFKQLRSSLMPITFQKVVTEYMNLLQSITTREYDKNARKTDK